MYLSRARFAKRRGLAGYASRFQVARLFFVPVVSVVGLRISGFRFAVTVVERRHETPEERQEIRPSTFDLRPLYCSLFITNYSLIQGFRLMGG